jgi:hypothetical protein
MASFVGLAEVGAGTVCGICPVDGVTGCIIAAGVVAAVGVLPPPALPLDAAGGFEAGDCAAGMTDVPVEGAPAAPLPAAAAAGGFVGAEPPCSGGAFELLPHAASAASAHEASMPGIGARGAREEAVCMEGIMFSRVVINTYV